MDDKHKADQYVEYINDRILPFIDYAKLQESYNTDMAYAKGVLNRLHEAMVTVYGGARLDEDISDDGFVVIPGVVRGTTSRKICLALLDLDLSSSGEHWGTAFLCSHGVVTQGDEKNDATAKVMKEIGSYDYGYTASIPGDIHVDNARLPEELKQALGDFRNHSAVLRNEQKEKPSVRIQIREAKKSPAELKKDKSAKKPGPEL